MKKLINKVKQWRVVGYGIIIASLYQNHDPQLATIEAFLLVILGESSARGIKTHSDSSLQSNPSSVNNNLGSPKEYMQDNLGIDNTNSANKSKRKKNNPSLKE